MSNTKPGLYPRGCYFLLVGPPAAGVYFNMDATGAGHPNATLLCSGARGPLRTRRGPYMGTHKDSLAARSSLPEESPPANEAARSALSRCRAPLSATGDTLGTPRYSRVLKDLPTLSSARVCQIQRQCLCSDGLADADADQPGRHNPPDGLAHALADLQPRWY